MSGRVLVAGAGAIGTVFGGFLAAAGADVTLLGRAPHTNAITDRGVRVEGLWGECAVTGIAATPDPRRLQPPYDVVLLTVKSYDTSAMLRVVAPLVATGGCVVSLQNGLGNLEQVVAAVGADRAVGARVIFGATLPSPGAARVTVCADPVAAGAAVPGNDTAEAHARAFVAMVAATPITIEYTSDVAAHLWTKVFYNAALNPLGALFGVPYGRLAEHAETREVMNAIIDECYAVAGARGVTPRVATADEYRALFYAHLVPTTADHRSSMLQDLERGRPTEIGAISGRIWTYGRESGIETPVNATMTRLIRWRERVVGATPRD